MARKPSLTEWHQKNGLWSRSLGNRGTRLRLFEKRSGGGFYRSYWRKGWGFDRKSLGTTDRAEAYRLGRELLSALLRDKPIARSGVVTLGDLWERYKAGAANHLDNHTKTQLGDIGRSKVLLGFFGKNCDVTELIEDDQLAFTRCRLAGGIVCEDGRVTKKVRGRSAEADLKLLNTMLKWGLTVRVGKGSRLLEKNPLAGLKNPTEKNPRRPIATWERFQATRQAISELVAESTAEVNKRKWTMLDLALVLAEATGRRLGSIRQLTWSDIDFTAETILWRAETDKKGKEWRIPFGANLQEELKAARLKLGGVFKGLLFPMESDSTKPIRTDVLAKWLLAAENRAGLTKLDGSLWHSYRRAWATERKHLPVGDVAAAGGWRDHNTLLTCYQLPDAATLLAVMNEPRKVSDRAKSA